jgi:hypothetical protein
MSRHQPVNFNILLKHVNAIRVACEIGDSLSEMPPGRIGDTSRCPIARALSNGLTPIVGGTTVTLTARVGGEKRYDFDAIAKALRQAGFRRWIEIGDRYNVKQGGYVQCSISFQMSKTMINFIERFDDNEFKDLIEGS